MSDTYHCWHRDPMFAYGNGASRLVCCYCGMDDLERISVQTIKPPGHGPHALAVSQRIASLPAPQPCPARSEGEGA